MPSDGVLIALITVGLPSLVGAIAGLWKWLTTRGLVEKRSARRVALSEDTLALYKQIIEAHERTIERLEDELGRRGP